MAGKNNGIDIEMMDDLSGAAIQLFNLHGVRHFPRIGGKLNEKKQSQSRHICKAPVFQAVFKNVSPYMAAMLMVLIYNLHRYFL